jgi:rubrerythrin
VSAPAFARALHEARVLEKEQTLFYRMLSAEAEDQGNLEDIEALNGLLADEQHHLSRLSVRLVELGEELEPLDDVHAPAAAVYPAWHEAARDRERGEVARYEQMLGMELDAETRQVIESILAAERQHEEHLAGKYTDA